MAGLKNPNCSTIYPRDESQLESHKCGPENNGSKQIRRKGNSPHISPREIERRMKCLRGSLMGISTTCPLNLIWSQMGSFTYTCFQVAKRRHYKFQWFFLKNYIVCWILIKEHVKIYWNPRGDDSCISVNFHCICKRLTVNFATF